MGMRKRLTAGLGTVAALAVLAGLGLALSALLRGSGPSAATTYGHDVADLLANPPAAGQTVELDAYFTGGEPMVGDLRVPVPGQVSCPTDWAWQVALTDRPFPEMLRYLNGAMSNSLPEDGAWLAAVTPEGTQPGQRVLPQLPYHARFRGHLGDPAFAQCANGGRIFVVEAVVETYEAKAPEEIGSSGLQPPEGLSGWKEYHDAALGYSLPQPDGWAVTAQASPEPGILSTVTLRSPQWPGYPVQVRVHSGETWYDQYVPSSIPPLLQADGFGVYGQGGAFGRPLTAHLLDGFVAERKAGPGEQEVSALFSGNGYTYELTLRFPLGFEASQELLTTYTAIVERFQLDVQPGPTPTAPVRQSLGPGPFLTSDEAFTRIREKGEGEGIELISARLVPEAETRVPWSPCSTFFGHPDGVWLVTVHGTFDGLARTMLYYVDATTGESLCGEEITPGATPWPTMPPGTTATPVPTETAVP